MKQLRSGHWTFTSVNKQHSFGTANFLMFKSSTPVFMYSHQSQSIYTNSESMNNGRLHAICMSYRVPPLTYRRTPSSHKDRKGSFTTRPTGKVPGYKKCDNKGLTIYSNQHAGIIPARRPLIITNWGLLATMQCR